MKKTLATILALVMVLSVMSLTAIAADEITVNGDVSEWTGWVNVSAKDGVSENGTAQNDNGGKVNASYDYAVKVVGDTLYIAVKMGVKAIGVAEPAQTTVTNIRVWIDNDMTTTARSALFDFGFNGETVVDSRANNDGTNKIPYEAACKAEENSYSVEIAIKLADLGITDAGFRYAFTVSSPELGVTEDGSLVYSALHSIKYEAGGEPWTTTEGYTVYSEEEAGDPTTSEPETSEPETSTEESKAPAGNPNTGDPMMVFVLISLITIAGTVVAVKRVR